jgi:3-deoxy-D-manno-octulosonate 8-phosphate phosphatase KdsC-like HAD superfamily phosphatase
VITGQHNPYAERFAQRERLHGVYMGFTNKPEAFEAFLTKHGLQADEVAFFFDDVLDLPVAARCGLRVMIGSPVTTWLVEQLVARGEVDIVTANSGGNNGLREATVSFLNANGVDGAQWAKATKEFHVVTKIAQAKRLGDAYKIDGVPTFGVHGRFFTGTGLAGDHQRALAVTDFLLQRVRKPT